MSTATTCPKGHDSEWPDWCSVCGERLADAASTPANPAAAPDAPSPDRGPATAAPGAQGPSCSNCGVTAHPDDAFCESCGYDFASGTLPVAVEAPTDQGESNPAEAATPTTPLTVSVSVDAEFFAATTADIELHLPEPVPDASDTTLNASRNLVGRHSQSRGILPEIDVEALTGDPGVSSRHLMIERTSTGQWTFTDLGSTNGTYLSPEASADPVTAGTVFPIDDAMSLWVGAWTRLDFRS